jgi:Flp pilus assembly protein TadD
VGALRDAVRLAPDWPLAAEALAWLLATGGDGRPDDGAEAVRLAEAARSGAGADDPRLLDTLGAAYAANGRFADAAVAGRRAAALARERGDDRFAADVETRVALYQAGRAVRSGTRVAPR